MLRIRPLQLSDLAAICHFTDREIGAGYFTSEELQRIFTSSQKDGVMCSLVLAGPHAEIFGVRITYPPGNWGKGKGKGLQPERWRHSLAETAYFQSLFVAGALRGQGWGGRISRAAIDCVRQIGARGIVTHSWKESPDNSSTKYLLKLGFVPIAEHPLYWQDVDYNCTRCLKPPCLCTAQEMYLDLERTL